MMVPLPISNVRTGALSIKPHFLHGSEQMKVTENAMLYINVDVRQIPMSVYNEMIQIARQQISNRDSEGVFFEPAVGASFDGLVPSLEFTLENGNTEGDPSKEFLGRLGQVDIECVELHIVIKALYAEFSKLTYSTKGKFHSIDTTNFRVRFFAHDMSCSFDLPALWGYRSL